MLTNQEIFDKVAKHLLTQNKKSVISFPDESVCCVYRNPEGLRCAIGCLIPDEKYETYFENRPADDDAILAACGLEDGNEDILIRDLDFITQLLLALQRVHDRYDPSRWKEELIEVAKNFGLNYSIVTNFQGKDNGN